MTGFGRKHRRLSISNLVKGMEIERWPEWVRDKEVEAVIVYTLDRLSRDPVHFTIPQEGLEKAGVELILVTETIDSSDLGRLITYIKGYTAKLEAQKIRERIT